MESLVCGQAFIKEISAKRLFDFMRGCKENAHFGRGLEISLRKNYISLIIGLVVLCHLGTANAVIFPFQIFTNDGKYNDDPGTIFKVDVTNDAAGVKFTFYNQSTIGCTIARIYFDNGPLLSVNEIINGPGVNFGQDYPGPGNLPAGKSLDQPFVADRALDIGALSPPPKSGLNNDSGSEWLQVKFNLKNGFDLQDVIHDLDTGELRVGLHIISFPDGSSESAVTTPEPATILLIGIGMTLIGIRRKKTL
jgi:hypothetical protein